MDTSSSEELTSDEEIDQIIESAWAKTQDRLNDTTEECNIREQKSQRELAGHSENDGEDDLTTSPCFVLDKTRSSQKTRLKANEDLSDDNDINESSSLFVVDKQPSLLNPQTTLSTKKEGLNETKKQSKRERNAQRRMDRVDRRIELSSSLKVNWDSSDIYVNLHSKYAPQPKCGTPLERISKETDEIMKKSVVTPDFEKKEAVPSHEESRKQKQKQRKQEREKTKGRGWYNMPKGEITDETKNDLMALKMRRALDPKRFYKGDDIKGTPKYFQFGTVVEDASEFYSARIPKKQRKKSMVEELMADAEFRKFNKRKYSEIQEMKAKGLGPYQGVRTMKTMKKKKRR